MRGVSNKHCLLTFFIFGCLLIFFSKFIFFKNFFQEYHQSVKQFGSRLGRHFVGPDLGPNCLQKLSADDHRRHIAKESFRNATRVSNMLDTDQARPVVLVYSGSKLFLCT